MSGEMVFTVSGASATVAQPISLADAGLNERGHLQEWALAHPVMLGPDVKVVAFEFGRWATTSGALARDRLDVLGLDRDGRLVVVELKRDEAPDTVDMQALKYAALVSRFTRDDLAKVHAQYLTRQRGELVSAETAAAELEEWATLTEESLRLPRLILLAADFPATVTATVVFLHQQCGLDVQLRKFQAYRTSQETLVTVSQLYPPPDVEDFVLSPEVSEQRLERTERQRRQREATTVSRLVEAGALEPGDRLEFRAPNAELQAQLEPWLADIPERRWATWQDDTGQPLVWKADEQAYSPTGLAKHILEEGADQTGAIQGPLYWIDQEGRSLVEITQTLPPGGEVDPDLHLNRLAAELRPVYESLNEALLGLGPDMTVRSRVKGFKYYRRRKLCDVLIHGDHLSIYVRNLTPADDDTGLAVGGTGKYVHIQVRTVDEVQQVLPLLRRAYGLQGT
jgi:predicted transport protein